MTVSNGQLANQTTFNNAFASKAADNTLSGAQSITSSTSSVDPGSGALIVAGGVGVGENLNVGALIRSLDTTDSTDFNTGAITTDGGLGVELNANIGGDLGVGGNIQAVGAVLGSNLSGTNSGDLSLAAVGSTPNANAASLAGQILTIQPANGTNPGVVTTASQTFAGDKTFNDDVIIQGDLTVNGTTTSVNSTNLDVADKNVTVNNGGNDASAEGAGLTVERTGTNGSLVYENALTSKWKIGAQGSESEVITAAGAQTLSGNKTISGTIELQNKLIGDVQTDSTATGIDADVPAPAKTNLRLTNSSLVSILTISGASSDQKFDLHNVTGNSITIKNSNAGATNILTGTGADITLANNAGVSLFYDSASSRFRLLNGTGGGGIVDLTTGVMGILPIANGGTNSNTASGAFDNLSPNTTKGDITVRNATTNVRQAVGANNTILIADSAQATGVKWAAHTTLFTNPSVQRFTSGSGTYTAAAGVRWIRVRMTGAGGGGGGSGASGFGVGGTGGDTNFASNTTAGGTGGGQSGNSVGGTTPTVGTGTALVSQPGGSGSGSQYNGGIGSYHSGGAGGINAFGGAGAGGSYSSVGASGTVNSGGGGGGAGGNNSALYSGGGGGAGAYLEVIVNSPAASYSYGIGAGGSGGTAGISGFAGGAGAAGIVIVEEYYQ